jgi:hypothetical protein
VKEVSRYQNEILDSPHTPKNQRNFSHFFALASKKWSNKKIKPLYAFIEAILHILFDPFVSTSFNVP